MNLPTKEEWERIGDLLSDLIAVNPDEATNLYQLMTVARAIADGRLVVCERGLRAESSTSLVPVPHYEPATTIPEET